MREISFSISAASSAAAHAAPPPTAIAARRRPSPLSEARPRLGVGHRLRGARRVDHAEIAAHHGQSASARVRARERLRVRDRPLRMHLLEHDGVGGGGERRVGVRGDRHARARAGALRDLDHVAELARRGHGEHRVARLPGKALAGHDPARKCHQRRPAELQPRQPQRVRDVVRRTVAGGDDALRTAQYSSRLRDPVRSLDGVLGARPEAAGHQPTTRSPGTAWTGTYHEEPKRTKCLDSRTTGLDSQRPMSLSEASQPLYHRVYREISKEIENGALQPGDRLPSERWLCDELGVSRATVRRAIEELTVDGLVEGRGRGSFVTGDALAEPPAR